MALPLSRRKLAQYAAGLIVDGKTAAAIQQLAAYLVQNNRMREADLVVRDIEMALMEKGVVLATVTSARSLTDDMRREIHGLLKAEHVNLAEVVDPSVLGGVRIDIPGARYDATVRRKLELLTEKTLS